MISDYIYKKNCSCCGYSVTKEDLLLEGNNDTEGNFCHNCYFERIRQNYYEIKEIIIEVSNRIKNNVNKFKFLYKPFNEQSIIIFNLIEKGYINFKIK